jgi:hypothetical protein
MKKLLLALLLLPFSAQAAITFIDENNSSNSGITARTVTEPDGAAEDDLLLGFCSRGNDTNDGTWTDPADWTEITQKDDTTGSADRQMYVGYKVRGSSAGDTLTFSFGGTAAGISCVVMAFRGVDTSTPFDVTYVEATHYNTFADSGANDAARAITTVTNNAWVVLLQAFTIEIEAAGSPSGYTERFSVPADVTSSHSRHIYGATKEKATAGVETPGVWTHTETDGDADTSNFTLAHVQRVTDRSARN